MYSQRCRWVFKSGWASSSVVGIICPLVIIWLTELPKSGWAKAHPATRQLHHCLYLTKLPSQSVLFTREKRKKISQILVRSSNKELSVRWISFAKNVKQAYSVIRKFRVLDRRFLKKLDHLLLHCNSNSPFIIQFNLIPVLLWQSVNSTTTTMT